jgi:DNA-binding NarL/FixJ family response regulator
VIRVFIVGPSLLHSASVQNLFSARGIEVVGSAEGVDSLVSQWLEVEADVILVEASGDSARSVIDSLEAAELASEAAVVVLSDHPKIEWITEVLQKGALAVLPNDLRPEQLAAALEAAAVGLIVIHPAEANAIIRPTKKASPQLAEHAESLTRRESEVLQMLASGLANKEIAARLRLSEHTVKFHVASILGKLGAGSRTEAVSIGIRRGRVLL